MFVRSDAVEDIKLSPDGNATEGHGFYVDAHRQEFQTRLLAFLARSLGDATASGTGSPAGQ